jgi:Leucine-rich repeat (LRR) protein
MRKISCILVFLALLLSVKMEAQMASIPDSSQLSQEQYARVAQAREDSLRAISREIKLKNLAGSRSDTVKKVSLTRLNIKEIPKLSRFSKTTVLDFTGNKIEKISASSWPESDSLKSVILNGNQLKRIGFYENHTIEFLDLSENNFRRIPHTVKKLKSLKSLDLTKNRIRRIPRFIARMDSLQELKLNHNQLKKLSKRDISKLKNLKAIQLGANELDELPANVEELTRIETINVGINNISQLPDGFAKLTTLKHLIFYRNQFDSLPDEIWELTRLEELDFYHNAISSIPPQLARLENLQHIYLAYNELTTLPRELFQLKQLKSLYLHHNHLVFIPAEITQLHQLQYLDLGYNKIYEIPDFSTLKHLLEIDLQDNSLTEFPYTLTEIESLTRIYLMGNPFVMTQEEREAMETLQKELLELDIRLYY